MYSWRLPGPACGGSSIDRRRELADPVPVHQLRGRPRRPSHLQAEGGLLARHRGDDGPFVGHRDRRPCWPHAVRWSQALEDHVEDRQPCRHQPLRQVRAEGEQAYVAIGKILSTVAAKRRQ
jgi:hypothetical protein